MHKHTFLLHLQCILLYYILYIYIYIYIYTILYIGYYISLKRANAIQPLVTKTTDNATMNNKMSSRCGIQGRIVSLICKINYSANTASGCQSPSNCPKYCRFGGYVASTEIKLVQRCGSCVRSRDFLSNFWFPADQWRRLYTANGQLLNFTILCL